MTIAVLFGGSSPEYEVSLQSAYAVISHMDRKKYTPVLIGISRQGGWYLYHGDIQKIAEDTWCNGTDCMPVQIDLSRQNNAFIKLTESNGQKNDYGSQNIHIDAAFPVLHGKNGEDGTVQGIFELAGIPVIGCGVLASAICMDKDRAHKLVRAAGISAPRAYVLGKDMDDNDVYARTEKERIANRYTTYEQTVYAYADKIGYPLFVKPVKAGSSFGIAKVHNKSELPDEELIKDVSVSNLVYYYNMDDISYLLNLGASIPNDEDISDKGFINLDLSPEIDHLVAEKYSIEIPKMIVTARDFYDIKSISYFENGYTYSEFLADIDKCDISKLPFK